jgi:hypothetical protein
MGIVVSAEASDGHPGDAAQSVPGGSVAGADLHAGKGGPEEVDGLTGVDVCGHVARFLAIFDDCFDSSTQHARRTVGELDNVSVGATEFANGADAEAATACFGGGAGGKNKQSAFQRFHRGGFPAQVGDEHRDACGVVSPQRFEIEAAFVTEVSYMLCRLIFIAVSNSSVDVPS